MTILQYIIYMDESGKDGRYFGNIYGGALVRSTDFERVVKTISAKKQELHLFKEVKWQRVTSQYLQKYIELMDCFFDFVEMDIVKIRVMFTQNYRRPINLTKDQLDNTFTQLYYQFFKHAFGLPYSNSSGNPISLRLYFDELPIHKEKAESFKKIYYQSGHERGILTGSFDH